MLRTEYEARLGQWSDIQGHLPTLHATVLEFPKAKVLELGVRWGTSTACLLAAVEEVGGHLWSVDISQPAVPDWWAGLEQWTLTVGNDVDPAIADAQPSEVDVLFLDTSHVFEQTLTELATFVPRVRPGGVVLCHDTELQAPEDAPYGPPFPVARALDEYCGGVGLSWENQTGSYGLGVIRVPA